jgi:hypothetical protein
MDKSKSSMTISSGDIVNKKVELVCIKEQFKE